MKMLPQVISVFLVKNILLKAFMPCNELNKVHGLIYIKYNLSFSHSPRLKLRRFIILSPSGLQRRSPKWLTNFISRFEISI